MPRYADYVDHPRYGRAPRWTGLDPDPDAPDVTFNNAPLTEKGRRECEKALGITLPPLDSTTHLIRGTAVVAGPKLDTVSCCPPSHYADLDCACIDCTRRFIFFADEQRFWYEELGFPIEAFAVRCHECRRAARGLVRARARYEELYHHENRNRGDSLEMAECCLDLMEAGVFSYRQRERVRQLLNTLPADERGDRRPSAIEERLHAYEASARTGGDST
ncbi:MAG: zinc-ribbon domain containing protein [Planctomycetota bacterium]|jgi:hypothetical protein